MNLSINTSIFFFHSLFRFIDFGRGKNIPLTPDTENLEQIKIKSNTGRIVIDKTIADFEFKNNILSNINDSSLSPPESSRYVIDKDGKIIERKKKCRLYSLGGYEPRKQSLVRMKTVGTFDLCMEVTAAATCGFNKSLNDKIQTNNNFNTNIKNNNIDNTKILEENINEKLVATQNEVNANNESTVLILADKREASGKKEKEIEFYEEKNLSTTISISPKRQRNISSSDNSLSVDDNLLSSSIKKKFRSLSSNSCLENSIRNSEEYRCKSAELLDSNIHDSENFNEILTCAASARDFCNKSEENIFKNFRIVSEIDSKTSDDEIIEKPFKSIPINLRRRTFKKSKKIIRTDSELFKDQILVDRILKNESYIQSSNINSNECTEKELTIRNISTDTVFSEMCEEEEQQQVDLERLENEYKEHIRCSLQREYKSDGDILDEIGKHHHGSEWKNQSIDFNFFEDNNNINSAINEGTGSIYRMQSCTRKADSVTEYSKSARKDSGKRTKSEGDKDTIYVSKNDSIETQSTEEDNNNSSNNNDNKNNDNLKKVSKIIKHGTEINLNKELKPLSLFERRFGKFRKMNKLLKVKRFSTSALYDNSAKRKSDSVNPSTSKTKGDQQSAPLSLFSQASDLTSSKASLSSPKSLKGKKFLLKKRKFSFFGKSQSNNDININLKSIASKLSLLSRSNFDLSTRNSSNLRLNAMGIYGKYGTSNEYRSDILTVRQQHGCTSPLSEAFYNATGSYQLTPMELFEKFCSQDFTGLYKHESFNEAEEKSAVIDTGHSYKGAIKKSSSLRKATLLKQNSEPKFNIKNYPSDYYNPHDAFEEEEIDAVENDYEYEMRHSAARRRSSYTRQHQVEFDQNDQYFEDNEGQFYDPEDEDRVEDIQEEEELYRNSTEGDIDEIYLMPEKESDYASSFLHNQEEILAIDETDEEIVDNFLAKNKDEIDIEESKASSFSERKNQLLSLYEICPKDIEDGSDECTTTNNLKSIITEYVKNASDNFTRSKSMDLLSNSSETLKTNSNSEYAFDTVKQINLDSCSTSKLSLSLSSDIFDDITLATAPPLLPDATIKTLRISEIDDFTITPDGSITENSSALVNYEKIPALLQISEQEKIKNELQSQYTIIDCDELEHDDDDDDMRRYNDEKSSFAEALNKEFDKLFSRAKNDSDTDLTTTPSVATTVLTAIKLPSRCSMEKLEPFDLDSSDTIIGGISEDKGKTSIKLLSQSMTSTTLHPISIKTENEVVMEKNKSKRSHSLGAINKKKSNKCTPL